MIRLAPHVAGTVLGVRAYAGARRTGIAGVHDGLLKVCVTQRAEKGKANEAIVDVLAKELGLRKIRFVLLAGETSPRKRFLVRSIDAEPLMARISAALTAVDE